MWKTSEELLIERKCFLKTFEGNQLEQSERRGGQARDPNMPDILSSTEFICVDVIFVMVLSQRSFMEKIFCGIGWSCNIPQLDFLMKATSSQQFLDSD